MDERKQMSELLDKYMQYLMNPHIPVEIKSNYQTMVLSLQAKLLAADMGPSAPATPLSPGPRSSCLPFGVVNRLGIRLQRLRRRHPLKTTVSFPGPSDVCCLCRLALSRESGAAQSLFPGDQSMRSQRFRYCAVESVPISEINCAQTLLAWREDRLALAKTAQLLMRASRVRK